MFWCMMMLTIDLDHKCIGCAMVDIGIDPSFATLTLTTRGKVEHLNFVPSSIWKGYYCKEICFHLKRLSQKRDVSECFEKVGKRFLQKMNRISLSDKKAASDSEVLD